jgi:T5SS/PEP-CTERM-associated repeat protein
MKLTLPVLICLALSVTPLFVRAQLVNDGSTNTLSNVTNTVAGDVTVGTNGSFTLLILSDNSLLTNSANGVIGRNATARSNEVRLVSATGRWFMGSDLLVGNNGAFNRLAINNGARVSDHNGILGGGASSTNNLAVVTGPGSSWNNALELRVGDFGAGNQLVVSNGGLARNNYGVLGRASNSSNNQAVVTGPGSEWSNFHELYVGNDGAGNRLVVSNGGVVLAVEAVYVGFNPTSTNNLALVDGGSLRATNAAGTALLEVRRGTNVLNSGLIDVNQLVLTNALGLFEFNGGTLQTGNTTVSNAHTFLVGTGTSAATLRLQGGTHSFANQLLIAGNSSLAGNGTVSGTLILFAGGNLSPGASIGKIVLSLSPVLHGAVIMEISKNGATLTNDQIQVTAPLTYGGLLTVSNLGPTTLAIGDRFPLFSATSYAGAFSVVSLPSLPAGLNWMNKLLVDGSIEVVASPKFTNVTLSGTNVVVSGTGGTPNAPYAVLTATNVVLPLSNWASIATNQFDPGGGFTFTNGIDPGIPQRFFGIRTP